MSVITDIMKEAERHPALDKLLTAKQLSDRKRYLRKNQILRELMTSNPDDFTISEEPNYGVVGVSHIPTNFRIHTLVSNLPTGFLQNYEASKQQDAFKTAAAVRLNYVLTRKQGTP